MQLKQLSRVLQSVYYNLQNPVSFSGVNTFSNHVVNKTQPRFKVKQWLLEQDAHTLHAPVRQQYPTNHYLIFGANELYEIDLIHLLNISQFNYGYKYILVVIDCFTKYVWAAPLQNKRSQTTTTAFRKILEQSGQIPKIVNCDRGGEFNSAVFNAYLKTKGIQLNFPYIQSKQKASFVERVIRTIKTKIYKYFTSKGPKFRKYIDVLPAIIKSYNESVHSTTKMAPANFQVRDTVQVYRNIRAKTRRNDIPQNAKFRIGDFVRIVRKKSQLEHGYTETYTREVFRINKVIFKQPIPLYELSDLKNTAISGKFYGVQLSKVNFAADTPVRIINTRKTRSNIQYNIETGDGSKVWMNKSEYDTLPKK